MLLNTVVDVGMAVRVLVPVCAAVPKPADSQVVGGCRLHRLRESHDGAIAEIFETHVGPTPSVPGIFFEVGLPVWLFMTLTLRPALASQ